MFVMSPTEVSCPCFSGGRKIRRQLSRDDIGNQGRVLLNDFIVDRMRGDNVQGDLRQEELLEPGTPSGELGTR